MNTSWDPMLLASLEMITPNEHSHSNDTKEQQTYYTIEQIATRTNLTKRTLRYYEEVGLLPPADRTEGNYRRYTQFDLVRIERIKELRDLLGFSLHDIRQLLEADDERGQIKAAYRQEAETSAKLAQIERADELLYAQLKLIEQKIAGLTQMRLDLLDRLARHEQVKKDLVEEL
jgi:DNA-binding transcriptional MerR regulator